MLQQVRRRVRRLRLQHARNRTTLEVPDNCSVSKPLRQLQSSIAIARSGSLPRRPRTCLFSCRRMALSLTGIPKWVSNLSLTLPPAAWPNSLTSSPTRCVFRANGRAIARFSANVFRAHCSLRHFQRPERSSSVAEPLELETPEAVAHASYAAIWKPPRNRDTTANPSPRRIPPNDPPGTPRLAR